MTATLVPVDPTDVQDLAASWLPTYNSCFTSPPWNEPPLTYEAYVARIGGHLTQPGFRGIQAIARRTSAGADRAVSVVGVAYGWPTPHQVIDAAFYQSVREGLGDDVLSTLAAVRAFEVVELMVAPWARGQGLGARLLEELCAGDLVCWLATTPSAPAVRLYRRHGFEPATPTFTASTGIDLQLHVRDRRHDERLTTLAS